MGSAKAKGPKEKAAVSGILLDVAGTGAEIGATMNVLWFQVLLPLEFYWSSTGVLESYWSSTTGDVFSGRLLWFLVCTVLLQLLYVTLLDVGSVCVCLCVGVPTYPSQPRRQQQVNKSMGDTLNA